MSKFGTTSSNLFNNKIAVDIPDWMIDLRENANKYIKNNNLNIEFDKVGAFEVSKINERQNLDATPRDTIASLNNQKLIIDSKIELAKFLNNKYYKTNVRIAGNTTYLDTTIDGLQANFIFEYNFDQNTGKIKQASTFFANESEYPFSKAGFNECLNDLKTGNLKKSSTKIASNREAYIINREEIIRRYNGSIREASNKINDYLSKGMIVGAGSNSYATYYNPDEIFPKINKEIPFDKLGSFEYVNNIEHVSTNEHKSANNLSIEASKILASIFNDYNITNVSRDGNELLVNATVLNDSGNRCEVSFDFEIKNEKVASLMVAEVDDKRMSVKDMLSYINDNNDLVNKFLSNKSASKRIYNGTIISHRELKNKLASIIDSNKIDDFIGGLVNIGALKNINSTTYASNYTIPELLNKMSCETLSDNEVNQIVEYSKKYNNDMNRIAQKDTGIRDMESTVNDETLLYSANNYLSQHFKNYIPNKFKTEASLDKANYTIKLFDEDSGLSTDLTFKFEYNGNKVKKCMASLNNKLFKIEEVKNTFAKNDILNKYLQNNNGVKSNSSIIISSKDFIRRIQKISNASEKEINDVLNRWENNGKLIKLNNNLYGSKYTVEQLISMSNFKSLSDEEIADRLLKSKKNKNLLLTASYIKDNDTRNIEEKWSMKKMATFARDQIGTMFKDFDIVDADLNDDSYIVTAKLINPLNGLKIALNFNFDNNNGKISKLASVSNGLKTVSIDKIYNLLNETDNEVINKFNEYNNVSKTSQKIVISSRKLKDKLKTVINCDNFNNIIEKLASNNIINQIDSNNFVSEYSVNEIVDYLQKNNLTDMESYKIKTASYCDKSIVDLRGPKIFDSDNRIIEKPIQKLSPSMINTANNLKKIAMVSLNNKKITNNKYNNLLLMLEKANCPNDIEKIWKELKQYI